MVRKRRVKAGHPEVTYSWAKEQDNTNILIKLEDHRLAIGQFKNILSHATAVRQIVAHHLGISPDDCEVDGTRNWMRGSFNICVPVLIHGRKQVLMRFPISRTVPFQPLASMDLVYRRVKLSQIFKIYPSFLGVFITFAATCSDFSVMQLLAHMFAIRHLNESHGSQLASTWEEKRHDKRLRTNLFKGLSKILLELAKVPVPQIRSFVIDDNGYLTLSNRPLVQGIQTLEGLIIPVDIPRDMTYATSDSYVADILTYHDSRMRYQPNAVNDAEDATMQITALDTMRATTARFLDRGCRRGPFVFALNDILPGNIFVDDDWNIRYIIDLEWACSQPVEMIHPPYWLSNQGLDMVEIDSFVPLYEEFMNIFEHEEQKSYGSNPILQSEIMKNGLENGRFWFSLALKSPTSVFTIFYFHLGPKIVGKEMVQDVDTFIGWKVKDKAKYDRTLQKEFDVEPVDLAASETDDTSSVKTIDTQITNIEIAKTEPIDVPS